MGVTFARAKGLPHNAATPATRAAAAAAAASSLAVISVSEIGSTGISAAAASEAFVSLSFLCRQALSLLHVFSSSHFQLTARVRGLVRRNKLGKNKPCTKDV